MNLKRPLCLLLLLTLLTGCMARHAAPVAVAPSPAPTAPPAASPPPEPSPEPTPTPTPEPTVAPAMAAATANATKDAPQITDPATWNDAGRTTMEALAAQYAAAGMTLDEQEGFPYFLAVKIGRASCRERV